MASEDSLGAPSESVAIVQQSDIGESEPSACDVGQKETAATAPQHQQLEPSATASVAETTITPCVPEMPSTAHVADALIVCSIAENTKDTNAAAEHKADSEPVTDSHIRIEPDTSSSQAPDVTVTRIEPDTSSAQAPDVTVTGIEPDTSSAQATDVTVTRIEPDTSSVQAPEVTVTSIEADTSSAQAPEVTVTRIEPDTSSAQGTHVTVTRIEPDTSSSQAPEAIVTDPQVSHMACEAKLGDQRVQFEQQLDQLRAALAQKENMILLYQRENSILDKEKQAFRKEKELANKEKESTVIKFAMQEKLLIDAKKDKEAIEKQLLEAKREIKNISARFQAVNEEKSRITYIIDEKCNELRKYQRECEKLKTDYNHMESKLKYHVNKLNMEVEAKLALEKKLEEAYNMPSKMEDKAHEKLKIEYEANSILLKHEIERKAELIDKLTKDHNKCSEMLKQCQEQLTKNRAEKSEIANELALLQEEHNAVQNSYSDEMLSSAKLRGQLEELQVLKTQNTFNEEKIQELSNKITELETIIEDNSQDLKQLHIKETDLLNINKEMSESIVGLQNELCLLRAKAQGLETEHEILIKEKEINDAKVLEIEQQLKDAEDQRAMERQLLTKHLSEKTKMYEVTKMKLENTVGELEATKNKHATIVKELQREILKAKKSTQPQQLESTANGYSPENHTNASDALTERHSHSRNSSHSDRSGSQLSESDLESVATKCAEMATQEVKSPSKKHLVERILRLQQASARQTEKIDFLENHALSLVSELQKKSKVVQYYMIRDQAGALTSYKSDQNKSELAKYGNGVMAAIYGGIKGDHGSMSLELSLEINKKLQAVLEDTLLKNITLKENLDVLGLEVDNLTRKLRLMETNK